MDPSKRFSDDDYFQGVFSLHVEDRAMGQVEEAAAGVFGEFPQSHITESLIVFAEDMTGKRIDQAPSIEGSDAAAVLELRALRTKFLKCERHLRQALAEVHTVNVARIRRHHPVSKTAKEIKKGVLALLEELKRLATTKHNFSVFERELPDLTLLSDARITNTFPDEILADLNRVRQTINETLLIEMRSWFKLSSQIKRKVDELVADERALGAQAVQEFECPGIALPFQEGQDGSVEELEDASWPVSFAEIFLKIFAFCKKMIQYLFDNLKFLWSLITSQKTASRILDIQGA